jgi:hypothetical protein
MFVSLYADSVPASFIFLRIFHIFTSLSFMLVGSEGQGLRDLYPISVHFGALSLPLIPCTLLASVHHKFVNALQGITNLKPLSLKTYLEFKPRRL